MVVIRESVAYRQRRTRSVRGYKVGVPRGADVVSLVEARRFMGQVASNFLSGLAVVLVNVVWEVRGRSRVINAVVVISIKVIQYVPRTCKRTRVGSVCVVAVIVF